MWNKINNEAQLICKICSERNISISAAESCTGGLLSSSIVSIPGSSKIFKSSIVTYSNESKSKFLKIPIKTINKNGAVSDVVAKLMALNVLKIMSSDFSVGITGIAGPTGGNEEKPVGLVWIAVAKKNNSYTHKYIFKGNRLDVRLQSTLKALELLNFYIGED